MDLAELIKDGGITFKDFGITLVAILSLVQVAPIKINPWSALIRALGRALNAEVLDKINENEASNARYRIIRFDDEIRHDVRHTEEHFNQIMTDITDYERYCREHPDYPNNKAVSAIAKIKKTYEKCRDENSFI